MLKIGLTGGIASGKSAACQVFSMQGVPIIDADVIAHDIVVPGSPCYQQIVDFFGSNILHADRQLNRQLLRTKIFSDSTSKAKLESILHPIIRQKLIEKSEQVDAPYCIMVIPLLIEAKMTDLVDRVLVIDINTELQITRLCQRDGLSVSEAKNILSQQSSRQSRINHADDIIFNDASLDKLSDAVIQQHYKYIELANSVSNSCQSLDCHGE
jgi:dephospho-CoA kinase